MSKIFLFFIVLFFVFVFFLTINKDFKLVDCYNKNNICFYNNKKINIIVYISSEVKQKNNKQEFIVKTLYNNIFYNKNILISLNSKEKFFYGDYLSLDCFLENPKNSENSKFDYVKYLRSKSIYSICKNLEIKEFKKEFKKDLFYYIFKLKNYVKTKIYNTYENPNNGFIFGVLFGGDYLSNDLKYLFSISGISHITAVSGYNISIIISIISILFIYFGFNRFLIFYFLIFFLIIFCIFTGLSSSIIRASIMSLCFLLSLQFGRVSNGFYVLFFAGFFMVLFNPFLLVYDVGFQLSFLATFGIIFLNPLLLKILYFIPNFLGIKESFCSTFSAFIFTLPIIYINFGLLNFLSIVINLLILGYIPFLMLFGFVSIFLPQVSFLSNIIIKYIIFICKFFT